MIHKNGFGFIPGLDTHITDSESPHKQLEMAKTMRMLPGVALLMAVVLVAVAEDAGSGGAWENTVKDKAGSAADGAKSWKDWAVGKWKGKGDNKADGAAPTTPEKLGQTSEDAMTTTSETQEKASEGLKKAEGHAKPVATEL